MISATNKYCIMHSKMFYPTGHTGASNPEAAGSETVFFILLKLSGHWTPSLVMESDWTLNIVNRSQITHFFSTLHLIHFVPYYSTCAHFRSDSFWVIMNWYILIHLSFLLLVYSFLLYWQESERVKNFPAYILCVCDRKVFEPEFCTHFGSVACFV